MKDLTVEIPKKYKKALIERFSLKNAKLKVDGTWEIRKPCPLCKDYRSRGTCRECPFSKFGNMLQDGCLLWTEDLVQWHVLQIYITRIWWYGGNDKQARKQLKLLKKKARKLIKWV